MHSIKDTIKQLIGKSINAYNTQHVKDVVSELKFKEQYQGRIIDCMVGEVDDNYIITPETDSSIVKLEHSKEGVVKIPSIKGKTILVDADGNETDTPTEGCRLVSVGEEEGNKLIILSKNEDNSLSHKTEILLSEPLRSLPNGVCDEIVGNQLIRRIGYFILDEKVFNIGSESAGWKPQIQTIPFYKYCNRFKPELKVKTNSLCFSNRLSINKSFVTSDIEGLGFSSGNPYASYFGGRLKRDKIENQDGYSVANYINNTQILYELAEPTIEELPNSITLQGFDDTTMYIENLITPTVQYGYNALIPYKEEVLNQQQEVETNTLDIEQNIIPYLMDMEFNLMLMEDE